MCVIVNNRGGGNVLGLTSDSFQRLLQRSGRHGDNEDPAERDVVTVLDPSCDAIPFNTSLLVELSGNGQQQQQQDGGTTSDEMQLLGSGFTQAYRMFRCSRGDRSIQQVQITQATASTNTPDVMTFRYDVLGTCRGCGATDFRFFEQPSSDPMQRQRRNLQTNVCDCKGPTVQTFLDAYNTTIALFRNLGTLQSVTSVRSATEIQGPNCTEEFFDTNVFIDLEATDVPVLTGEEIMSLERGFRDAYNQLNTPTDQTCDSFFRTIQEAVYLPDVTLLNRRRQLQDITNPNLPGAPTAAPSVDISSLLNLRFFVFVFRVRGICRGCRRDANLFDDGTRLRRALMEALAAQQQSPRQLQPLPVPLQQEEPPDNTCACPAGATDFAPPSTTEFASAFNQTVATTLTRVDAVITNVVEVDPVPCSPEVTEFVAELNVTFSGFPDQITGNETNLLEFGIGQSYNELAQSYCDPSFRSILGATLVSIDTPTQETLAARRLQTFNSSLLPSLVVTVFRVQGRCRGCVSDTGLFDEGARRLLLREARENRGRRLEEEGEAAGGQCFCSTNNLGASAQSTTDFFTAYNGTLERWIGLGLVENVFEVVSVNEIVGETTAAPVAAPGNATLVPSYMPSLRPTETATNASQMPSAVGMNPSTLPSMQPSNFSGMEGMPSLQPTSGMNTSATGLPSVAPSSSPNVSVPSVSPSLSIQPTPDGCPSLDFDRRVLIEFFGLPGASGEELLSLAELFIESYTPECSEGSRFISSITADSNPASSVTRRLQGGTSRPLVYRFRVRGTCLGCTADSFTLFSGNEVVPARRRLGAGQRRRGLQGCVCFGPPLPTFETAYNETVKLQFSQGQLPTVESVLSVAELESVECSAEVTSFQSHVLIEFITLEPMIDFALQQVATELAAFGASFARTYNRLNVLNDDYCDPLFRVVDTVTFAGGAELSRRTRRLDQTGGPVESIVTLRFAVVGRCRGCEPTTNIFESLSPFQAARQLQQQQQQGSCFCSPNAPQRGVIATDFEAEMRNSLVVLQQDETVTVVSGIFRILELDGTQCPAEMETITTSVTLQMNGLNPETVTPLEAQLTEATLFLSYNQLSRDFFCDPLFRVVTGVSLESTTPSDTPGNADFQFLVQFRCRGCEADTLLFAGGIERRLQSDQLIEPRRRRTQAEECFCITDAVQGSPGISILAQFMNVTFATLRDNGALGELVSVISGVESSPGAVTPAPSATPSSAPSASTGATTEGPTMAAVTMAPATMAPATMAPATMAPVTMAPATMAPTTMAPVTMAPTTMAPVTMAPVTMAPATMAPVTMAPVTMAPATMAPVTMAPVTMAPVITPSTAPSASPTEATQAPTTGPTAMPLAPSASPSVATLAPEPSAIPTRFEAPVEAPEASPVETLPPDASPTGGGGEATPIPSTGTPSSGPSQTPAAAPVQLTPPIPPSPGFPACSVCGPDREISNSSAIVTIPDQDPVTCQTFQISGQEGFIPAEFCGLVVAFTGPCECVAAGSAEQTSGPTMTLSASTGVPSISPVGTLPPVGQFAVVTTFVVSNTAGLSADQLNTFIDQRFELNDAFDVMAERTFRDLFSDPNIGYRWHSGRAEAFADTTCPAGVAPDSVCHTAEGVFTLVAPDNSQVMSLIETAREAVQSQVDSGGLQCQLELLSPESVMVIETGGGCSAPFTREPTFANNNPTVEAPVMPPAMSNGMMNMGIGVGEGQWVQIGSQLSGQDPQVDESFGASLALSSDGATLAVGIPGSGNGGRVQVFDFAGSWVPREPLSAATANAEFGLALALSGDGLIVAVGAPGAGLVAVYEFDAVWVMLGSAIELPSGERGGESVALSSNGQTLVVGAPSAMAEGNDAAGIVRVYEFLDGTWLQLGQNVVGAFANGLFGTAVAISADSSMVAVGAPDGGLTGQGYVEAFRLVDGAVWSLLGQRVEPASDIFKFGQDVSLSESGLRLIIGAPNVPDQNGGLVQLVDYDAEFELWMKVGPNLTFQTPGDETGYAISVSANGRTVAVGRPGLDGNRGRVSSYRWNSMEWIQTGGHVEDETGTTAEWGRAVAMSANANRMAVGTTADAVQVYEIR